MVHPQTLSLGQQIALFEAAPTIVAAEGSAHAHPAVPPRRAAPAPGLPDLEPLQRPLPAAGCAQVRRQRVYMRCPTRRARPRARSIEQSFRLDPERAMDLAIRN